MTLRLANQAQLNCNVRVNALPPFPSHFIGDAFTRARSPPMRGCVNTRCPLTFLRKNVAQPPIHLLLVAAMSIL